MRMNKRVFGAVVFGMLLCSNASALTLAGGNVSYSFDAAQLGLFGTASVVGGNLTFTPTSFKATSGVPATGSVNIDIIANSGYTLSGFNLTESGGYNKPGAADGVYLTGNISVLDIEGDTSKKLDSNILTLAPLSTGGTSWTAQAGVLLPASGWGGSDGIVGSVRLTINNQLFATGSGEIWKNTIGVAAVTTPVPEAEKYAMMLVGLGLIGFIVRSRNRVTV